MTTLLAIDPGARTGWAHFLIAPGGEGALIAAGFASPADMNPNSGLWIPADLVVIEVPERTYAGIPEGDIMKLSLIAGRFVERYRAARMMQFVAPRDWKGTVKKSIMTARILAACTKLEREKLALVRDDHNAVDAVGLGKWSFRQPWMRGVS